MKKTYVWVFVADPSTQFVTEVHGPCNEHMMKDINQDLLMNPLQGFTKNTTEVFCRVREIAPIPAPDIDFHEPVYIPVCYECLPVKPLKTRKIEKVWT